jgi:predicted nucleic acid-binding protein
MNRNRLLVFVDSNILIEALFVPMHPASAIAILAANKQLDITTCSLVIEDLENEVMERVTEAGNFRFIDLWANFQSQIRLQVLPDPPLEHVMKVKDEYLGIMRHSADIPVLASAIEITPDLILSDNIEHFNAKVAQRCGIPIWTSEEYLVNMMAGTLKEKLEAATR